MTNSTTTSGVLHSSTTRFDTQLGDTLVNMNLDLFCLPQELSDEDFGELVEIYDERLVCGYWAMHCKTDPQSKLPTIFATKNVAPGRSPVFKRIRTGVLVDDLHAAGIDGSTLVHAPDLCSLMRGLTERDRSKIIARLAPRTRSDAARILKTREIMTAMPFSPSELFAKLRKDDTVTTPSEFIEWLCTLSNHRTLAPIPPIHVWRFLSVANQLGLLLFPFAIFQNSLVQRKYSWGQRSGRQAYLGAFIDSDFQSKSRMALISDFDKELFVRENRRLRCKYLFSILLHTMDAKSISRIPVQAIVSLRNEYQRHEAFHAMKTDTKSETILLINRTYEAIGRLLAANCSQTHGKSATDYKIELAKTLRSSNAKDLAKTSGKFYWLSNQQPELEPWARYFRDYVSSKSVISVSSLVQMLNVFADFLIVSRPIINHPSKIARRHISRQAGTNLSQTAVEYLIERYGVDSRTPLRVLWQIRDFFAWFIAEIDDSFSQPIFDLDIPVAPPYRGKTEKNALPARLLAYLRNIIVEDDFAWPRSLAEDRLRNDWCPVRAIAVYLLLTVPLRTIQVRQLDSGEGDEYHIDVTTGEEIPNSRGEKGRQFGVLRRIYDTRSSEIFIGLYINTNKTSAPSRRGRNSGYEIPWENKELNSLIRMLVDWQVQQNPVGGPRHVNECIDRTLHCSDAIADVVPPRYFLFRDPCTSDPAEPVSRVRLESFYLALLAECERRMALQGEPITLIKKWKKLKASKKPLSAIVSLHSLRVSGITAFAEAGVPLQILTEVLAGHSTVLMNLYYQKFGPATVTEIIEKASTAWERASDRDSFGHFVEDNVAQFLSELENNVDDPTNPLALLLHKNELESIRNLAQHESAFWHIDIDGICPNGRTMCDTGGPVTQLRTSPVEGGEGNCPRCRYWVTGPMFLFGQLIKANVQLYELHEHSVTLAKLEDHLSALQENKNPARHELHRCRTAIDVVNARIENGLHTWVKRYQFVSQSLDIQSGPSESCESKFPLIASEDELPSLSLSDAHPFDLMEFVTQSCEVIPTVDCGTAILKKSRAIDALLERSNIEPFFFSLSDEVALQTGNQLTRFLSAQLPHEEILSLFDGHVTLDSLGIPQVTIDELRAIANRSQMNDPAASNEEGHDSLSVEIPGDERCDHKRS